MFVKNIFPESKYPLNIPGKKSLYHSLEILLLLSFALMSNTLQFPDSAGKIIAQQHDYIIRLLETPGSNLKTVEALFLIKASPLLVYKTVTDYKNYPYFMPNISKTELVGQKDSCFLYKFTFKIAFFTISYTTTVKGGQLGDGNYFTHWDYVSGDLKKTTGGWNICTYKQKEGYSLIRYQAYIDVGKLMPLWLTESLTEKSIPKMIAAIGKRVTEEN